MNKPILQAHRGVSTEFPENTLASVLGAIKQGYPFVELDPAVTADGEIVLLHDMTLNRTARKKDGSVLSEDIKINETSYEEALKFDFGIGFSEKFKGEKLPLLSEILKIAKENNITVKIDAKFQTFEQKFIDKLFGIVNKSRAKVAFTVNDLQYIEPILNCVPSAEVHYDGAVSEETLYKLSLLVPKEKLTVWLPYRCPLTEWKNIPFANEELCKAVKRYCKLGLWILSDENEYADALKYAPDIIETTGALKPIKEKGMIADMHTHSEHSHDSACAISDMAAMQKKRGTAVFAVTDHCDIEYFEAQNLEKLIGDSVKDSEQTAKGTSDIEILRGVEIGEGIWNEEVTKKIISLTSYDVVIGSVHAVRYEGYTVPYSKIDFKQMGKEKAQDYFDKYFDDVLEMIEKTDFDILAHLTCPLRYINGNFGFGISLSSYKEKIIKILNEIIKKNIALEVNTSCIGSGYNEFMPEEWIIAAYRDMGGTLITLGSDAHTAEYASFGFEKAVAMLKRNGFNTLCYFKNRHIYKYEI